MNNCECDKVTDKNREGLAAMYRPLNEFSEK